jgi:hypothetical protein
MLPIRSGDCILIIVCRDDSTSVHIHGRTKVLFQIDINGQARRFQATPARYTRGSMQAPGDEHPVTRAKESDLAGQRFSNLKTCINFGDVFVEIILSACANSSFQQLGYIKSHSNYAQRAQTMRQRLVQGAL